MARIRSIKPEFWTSGQILECSTNARLMFIGLWNFCDDKGRHPYRPKQIKAQIFPSDPFTENDILGMLQELSKNNLITPYTIEEQGYFIVNGWHHQRIDKPQDPKYPDPLYDDSGNILGTFPPDRIREDRIGKEGNGKDRKGLEFTGKPPALPVTNETWEFYSTAYKNRYGKEPVRNARVNSQLKQFVERLGITEAPAVAAYYLTHNNAFYLTKGHSVGIMLADAEKLRTEWATNTQITATKARQIDKTQNNISVYEEVKRELGLT